MHTMGSCEINSAFSMSKTDERSRPEASLASYQQDIDASLLCGSTTRSGDRDSSVPIWRESTRLNGVSKSETKEVFRNSIGAMPQKPQAVLDLKTEVEGAALLTSQTKPMNINN